MRKTCTISGKEFEITEDDLKFYEKMGVPSPTLCPEERMRRRMMWQNMQNLYWRICDGSGKRILSVYSLDKIFPVYAPDYWHSDKWDARDYGQYFDFSRPFFEQFEELWNRVPHISLIAIANENSDFVTHAGWNKNCYLIFGSDHNNDCYFMSYAFYRSIVG